MESLAIRLGTLGQTHPDVAKSYSNMAMAHTGKGEYDKALEFH